MSLRKPEDATEQINMILRERGEILIEWHKAFDTENVQAVKCIYEKSGFKYALILVNGDSRLKVSELWMVTLREIWTHIISRLNMEYISARY